MDAEDEGQVCSPGYQNYTIPTRKDMLAKGVTHACFEANQGNLCAQRTCCCDTVHVWHRKLKYHNSHNFI